MTVAIERDLDAGITATIPGESGGHVTLGAGQLITGTFAYAPTSAGTHVGRVRFTPGGPDCWPGAQREWY